jgi:hypothetical protein
VRDFANRHRKSLSGFFSLKNFRQENSDLSWKMIYTETELTKPQAAAVRSTIFLL